MPGVGWGHKVARRFVVHSSITAIRSSFFSLSIYKSGPLIKRRDNSGNKAATTICFPPRRGDSPNLTAVPSPHFSMSVRVKTLAAKTKLKLGYLLEIAWTTIVSILSTKLLLLFRLKKFIALRAILVHLLSLSVGRLQRCAQCVHQNENSKSTLWKWNNRSLRPEKRKWPLDMRWQGTSDVSLAWFLFRRVLTPDRVKGNADALTQVVCTVIPNMGRGMGSRWVTASWDKAL